MNIGAIIPFFRRHQLVELVLSFYRANGVSVIAAGSEGKSSRKLAEKYGAHYIEVPNTPLTQKNNALLKEVQRLNWDGCVLLGSDDFLTIEAFEHFNQLGPGIDYVVGFNDIYFYSTRYRKLSLFQAGKHGYGFGAGRYFSRKVLEKCNYTLWHGDVLKGLDANHTATLIEKGIKIRNINMSDIDCFLCDVKHEENITSENIIFAGEIQNIEIMARRKTGAENLKTSPKPNQHPVDLKSYNDQKVNFESNGKFFKPGKYQMPKIKAQKMQDKGYGKIVK